MKNPFEEKRKNDRINSLVKERDELKLQVNQITSDNKQLQALNAGLEAIGNAYDYLKKENASLQEKLNSQFNEGYNQAVWDVTHFLTEKQKQQQ